MDMDDWTLINVVLRPNTFEDDPTKGYWPVARFNPEDPPVESKTFKKMFFDLWRSRNLEADKIEERWREWSKGME